MNDTTVTPFDRRKLNQSVSYRMATDPDFAALVKPDDAGRRTYLLVLDDDPFHEVVRQIAGVGGRGTLVRPNRDDHGLALGFYRLTLVTVPADDDSDDHHVPVGPSVTVGMFLDLLNVGSSITVRLSDGSELRVDPPVEDQSRDGDFAPA